MDASVLATPVKVGRVTTVDLPRTVRATGHTQALEQQKVRAPFRGKLLTLRVADGQRVKDNEVVATVVSIDSEAALAGANAMVNAAQNPQEKKDAERALELAKRGVVQTPLHAPEAGVVVSHSVDEGALVTESEEVLTIAASDSIVFIADVVQTDVPKVHPGHKATVKLAAMESPLSGTVHAVLPSASSKDMTVPVRIDLPVSKAPVLVGLYGSVQIAVGAHPHVQAVPKEALLRDDVTGETRLCTVRKDGKAQWVRVETGIEADGFVEITSPALEEGALVITSGQVGLPDEAAVQVES
jgi:RND family efflux transporter MFP subunit